MKGYKHFSHPHALSFHKSLEDAQPICTGCNFPCTDTAVYSCPECKFYLHDQCFNATRSLSHPSHPDHPLSLFPFPTSTPGYFICNSCDKPGSGFCYCCPTCDFDLHIHCAYNTLNSQPSTNSSLSPIELKSHPNHPLKHFPNAPYSNGTHTCDVCGTDCDPNGALYRCDICDYDAHVSCTDLPETIRREDHEHALSLLHVNPFSSFICDVCSGTIEQNRCMYYCTSGCDYGMHVYKCVPALVSEEEPMNEMTVQLEMFKLENQTRVHQMASDTMQMGARSYYPNRY